MNFREDIFAKIVTYITVAVLLGAMLVEAFVIYRSRAEEAALADQLEQAQEHISSLTQSNQALTGQVEQLQEFKDNWKELVILADNELCQTLREDLYARPDRIPEEAVEMALLIEEADSLGQKSSQKAAPASFSFPSPQEKEWLLPLNLGNRPSVEYLFYARAEDNRNGQVIDLLYQIPVNSGDGSMQLDEDGRIIWNCMAYDAGLGWQLCAD